MTKKSKMRKYAGYLYNLLIYGSLVFFVIYLFRSEDFSWNGINEGPLFIVSLLFLLAAFCSMAANWHNFLKAYDIHVPFRTAFVSLGLTVFGKYIPGKVWLIIGRSGYVIRFKPEKAHILHISSTYSQLLWTFTGVVVGGLFIAFANLSPEITYGISLAIITFSILIFIPSFQRWCYQLLGKLMKKELDVPVLNSRTLLLLLPQFFLTWALFTIAFILMMVAMGGSWNAWTAGFAFILATHISYVVIFLPGGIGVREGLLTTFLLLKGFDKSTALSISVMSRFWFTIGEALFFIAAFVWKYLKRTEDRDLIQKANFALKKEGTQKLPVT